MGGVGGIPEGLGIAPADLPEDITWNTRKTVDTLESFKNGRCVDIFIVSINEGQDVAVEAKEQSNLRSSTQIGNNRCRLRSLALVDDERVVDGNLACCVDHSRFGKSLLGSDSLRARREELPRS